MPGFDLFPEKYDDTVVPVTAFHADVRIRDVMRDRELRVSAHLRIAAQTGFVHSFTFGSGWVAVGSALTTSIF